MAPGGRKIKSAWRMAPRHGTLYPMAKKKHGDRVGSGRLMWAAGGGSRLWDREGLEWQDADKEVDRAEATDAPLCRRTGRDIDGCRTAAMDR